MALVQHLTLPLFDWQGPMGPRGPPGSPGASVSASLPTFLHLKMFQSWGCEDKGGCAPHNDIAVKLRPFHKCPVDLKTPSFAALEFVYQWKLQIVSVRCEQTQILWLYEEISGKRLLSEAELNTKHNYLSWLTADVCTVGTMAALSEEAQHFSSTLCLDCIVQHAPHWKVEGSYKRLSPDSV